VIAVECAAADPERAHATCAHVAEGHGLKHDFHREQTVLELLILFRSDPKEMTDKKSQVPLNAIACFAAHVTEMIEDALYHRHAGERESGGNVRRGTWA